MASVVILAALDIWRWGNLKTTLVWAATFAVLIVFDVNRIKDDDAYFRKAIRKIISLGVVAVFISGLATFGLVLELGFMLLLAFAGAMYAIAQRDPKYSAIGMAIGWMLGLVGALFIGHGLYQIGQDVRKFATFGTARKFANPIILSLVFLPFVYVLGVYVAYEAAFVRLKFAVEDPVLRSYAKKQAILAFRFDVGFLRRWTRNLALSKPMDREDIRRSIHELNEIKKRERRPPIVPRSEGWSPYAAKEFLRKEGLATADYHRGLDEWSSSSLHLGVGTGIISDYITYYVEGDERVAKRLKLTLVVNDSNHPSVSELRFFNVARTLFQRAVGGDFPCEIFDQIPTDDVRNSTARGKTIGVSREYWSGGLQGEYSLNFTIEI